MMRASSIQALSAAKAQVHKPSRDWYMWCLKFVRTSWGIPATGIKDANAAWRMAKDKHPGNANPPAGAPVYWAVGKFGHIAISDGTGHVYSNDILRKGKIDRVPISLIARKWKAKYLGWSSDYCGRPLPLAPTKAPETPTTKPATKGSEPFPGETFFKNQPNSPIITAMGKRLVTEGCSEYAKGPGPRWGEADRKSYAKWQRKLGYTGKAADGWPGKTSWDKLKVPKG